MEINHYMNTDREIKTQSLENDFIIELNLLPNLSVFRPVPCFLSYQMNGKQWENYLSLYISFGSLSFKFL